MNSPLLIAFTALLLIAVAGTGYFAGSALYQENHDNEAASSDLKSQEPQEVTTSLNNDTKRSYTVGNPSSGPLYESLNLNLTFIDEKTAEAVIPLKDAEAVTIDQKIILYKKDGSVLPFYGRVLEAAFIPDNNQDALLTIRVPILGEEDKPAPKAVLILSVRHKARRLPVSAIQKDQNGHEYIWIAIRHQDNPYEASLIKRPVTIIMRTPHLVDIHNSARRTDFVVLNPDETLQEGQTVNIDIGDFVAPLITPTKQAKFDYYQKRATEEPAPMTYNPSFMGLPDLPKGSYYGGQCTVPSNFNDLK